MDTSLFLSSVSAFFVYGNNVGAVFKSNWTKIPFQNPLSCDTGAERAGGGGAVSLMDVFTAALHKPRSYLHPVSSALVSSSLAVCRKLRCAWMKWTKIVFFPAGFRFASKRQQGSLYLALLLEAVRHSEMQLKWCPHPWVNEWMLGQFVFCSSLIWSWMSPRVVVG